jgi:hypothetical protein
MFCRWERGQGEDTAPGSRLRRNKCKGSIACAAVNNSRDSATIREEGQDGPPACGHCSADCGVLAMVTCTSSWRSAASFVLPAEKGSMEAIDTLFPGIAKAVSGKRLQRREAAAATHISVTSRTHTGRTMTMGKKKAAQQTSLIALTPSWYGRSSFSSFGRVYAAVQRRRCARFRPQLLRFAMAMMLVLSCHFPCSSHRPRVIRRRPSNPVRPGILVGALWYLTRRRKIRHLK